MTDGDVLVMLRGYLGWPARLDVLAVQAAKFGRLAEANAKAEVRLSDGLEASSVSSVTIAPSRVPDGNYSNRPNRSATFYDYLEMELRYVLGMPIDFTSTE